MQRFSSSMYAFILGHGDVSPDLLFILHCQLSSLHPLLSCWLTLSVCLEGRIYVFLEGTNRTRTIKTRRTCDCKLAFCPESD